MLRWYDYKGSVLTHAMTFLQKCDEVSFFRLTLLQPAPLIHTQLSPYSYARPLCNVAEQGRRHQISPGGRLVLAWEMKTACHAKWILRMIFCRKFSKVIRQLAQPPYLFLCTRSKVEMIRAIFEQWLSLASHVLEWVRLMWRVLTVSCDTAVTSELRWETALFARPSGRMSFICPFLSFILYLNFTLLN